MATEVEAKSMWMSLGEELLLGQQSISVEMFQKEKVIQHCIIIACKLVLKVVPHLEDIRLHLKLMLIWNGTSLASKMLN